MRKFLLALLAVMPNFAMAQFQVLEIEVKEPSYSDRMLDDPTNVILLALGALVAVLIVVLIVRNKKSGDTS